MKAKTAGLLLLLGLLAPIGGCEVGGEDEGDEGGEGGEQGRTIELRVAEISEVDKGS